jgi:hypothetical protein
MGGNDPDRCPDRGIRRGTFGGPQRVGAGRKTADDQVKSLFLRLGLHLSFRAVRNGSRAGRRGYPGLDGRSRNRRGGHVGCHGRFHGRRIPDNRTGPTAGRMRYEEHIRAQAGDLRDLGSGRLAGRPRGYQLRPRRRNFRFILVGEAIDRGSLAQAGGL